MSSGRESADRLVLQLSWFEGFHRRGRPLRPQVPWSWLVRNLHQVPRPRLDFLLGTLPLPISRVGGSGKGESLWLDPLSLWCPDSRFGVFGSVRKLRARSSSLHASLHTRDARSNVQQRADDGKFGSASEDVVALRAGQTQQACADGQRTSPNPANVKCSMRAHNRVRTPVLVEVGKRRRRHQGSSHFGTVHGLTPYIF